MLCGGAHADCRRTGALFRRPEKIVPAAKAASGQARDRTRISGSGRKLMRCPALENHMPASRLRHSLPDSAPINLREHRVLRAF